MSLRSFSSLPSCMASLLNSMARFSLRSSASSSIRIVFLSWSAFALWASSTRSAWTSRTLCLSCSSRWPFSYWNSSSAISVFVLKASARAWESCTRSLSDASALFFWSRRRPSRASLKSSSLSCSCSSKSLVRSCLSSSKSLRLSCISLSLSSARRCCAYALSSSSSFCFRSKSFSSSVIPFL